MADELSAELALDIGPALATVDDLGQSIEVRLSESADSFQYDMVNAIEGLPPVELESNAEAIPPSIEDAITGADSTVPLDGDGAAIPGDIDSAIAAADPTVLFDGDSSGIPPAIADGIGASDTSVEFEADTGQLSLDLQGAIDSADTTVQLTFDGLEGLAAEVSSSIDAADTTVIVDADVEAARSEIQDLGDTASSTGGQIDGLQLAVGGLDSAQALATGSADTLGDTVSKFGGGAQAAVGAVTALATGTGLMFHEAVNAQGATFRLNQTMGELASKVETIRVGNLNSDLSDLALTLGSDDDKMRQTAASAFNMATTFGKSREESAQFAGELLAVTSRSVALNPALGDVGDASNNLLRALQSGRERALIPYQLGLSAAAINAKALTIAQADGRDEVNASDKAFAGIALSVAKFGDTLDQTITQGAKNPEIQLRALKQEVIENIEALGMPLVAPIFDLMEAGIPVALQFARVIADIATAGLPVITVGLEAITPLLTAFADGLHAIGPEGIAVALALFGVVKVVQNFQQLMTTARIAMMLFSSSLSITPVGALAIGLGVAVTALGLFSGGQREASASSQQLTDSLRTQNGELDSNSIGLVVKDLGDLNKGLTDAGISSKSYTDALQTASSATRSSRTELQGYYERVNEAGAGNEYFVGVMERISPELGRMAQHLVDTGNASYDLKQKIVDQALAVAEGGRQAKIAADAELDQAQALDFTKEKADQATEAQNAHKQALFESSTAYQQAALAANLVAAADANSVAQMQASALAARSSADASNAVAQEKLSLVIAEGAATDATARYAFGQGTASEATNAVNSAVQLLRTNLQLLTGNYYGSINASLALEQQSIQFNDTLDKQNGTLGANRLEVIASEQALTGMGNAANSASIAALQNGESIDAQIAPLQNYQNELETVKQRLIASSDEGGAAFVQNLQDANQRAIDNLNASRPGFQGAASNATAGAAQGVRDQSGNVAGAGTGVGQQGAGGFSGGINPIGSIAYQAVENAATQAGLAGANMHNIGLGIGMAFSEGLGDGIYANEGYIAGAARDVSAGAVEAARQKLGIGSPSKVMRDEVGLPIMQGMALGITKNAGLLYDAMTDTVSNAAHVDAFSPFTSAADRGARVGGSNGGGPPIVFNIDVTGVSDIATARRVGSEIGESAADALARRGYVTVARLG